MVKMNELPQGGSQKSEYYEMTKDGFSFLVMGYTAQKPESSRKGSSTSSTDGNPC